MINQPGLEGNILNLIKGIFTENPTAQDFPDGPVVKNLPAKCRGHRFDSWSRKLPHAFYVPQLLSQRNPQPVTHNEKPPHRSPLTTAKEPEPPRRPAPP